MPELNPEKPGSSRQKWQDETLQPKFDPQIPGVRMQSPVGAGGGLKERPQAPGELTPQMQAELRYQAMFAELGMVRRFIENLKQLETLEKVASGEVKLTPKEKEGLPTPEAVRKEIVKTYTETLHEGMDEIGELHTTLEELHNPYPYDSRYGLMFFKRFVREMNQALRDEKIGAEGKAWLKKIKRDAIYGQAAFQIVEAMGPVFEMAYFDGELQLQVIRTTHSRANASVFQAVFQEKVPGLELDETEKELVAKSLSVVKENNRLAEVVEKGLREHSIGFQDDADYWRKAVASAHQYMAPSELVKHEGAASPEDIKPNDTWQMHLTEIEREFLNELFGKGEEYVYKDEDGNSYLVRQSYLNRFHMEPTEENERLYQATMQELLLDYPRETMQKLLEKTGAVVDKKARRKELQDLALKIKGRAEERVKNWFSQDEGTLRERAAWAAVRGGIILELGTMASGELGWGWEYKRYDSKLMNKEELDVLREELKLRPHLEKLKQKRDDGTFVLIDRESGIGGIYSAFDAQTVMHWMRHLVDYDNRADSRSSTLPPTMGSYRILWKDKPPYWQPPFGELSEDETINDLRDMVFNMDPKSEGYKYRHTYEIRKNPGEKPVYFGDLPQVVLDYMKKYEFAFATPFFNNWQQADNLVYLPIYMPTTLKHLNFWREVTLDKGVPEDKRHVKTAPSIYDGLLGKSKLSSFDYSLMGRYAEDWYRVNIDQTRRWLAIIVNPAVYSEQIEGEVKKFTGGPGLSQKEFGKRTRLGLRGSSLLGKGAEVDIAFGSFLTVLQIANENNFFDPVTAADTGVIEKFENEINKWAYVASTFPNKFGIKNYGNSVALMTHFWGLTFLRYAKVVSQTSQEYKVMNVSLKSSPFLTKSKDKFAMGRS